MLRSSTVALALLAPVVLAVAPADAATTRVASWPMNEPPGARVMVDHTGDHDGAIGSDVVLNRAGYTFPAVDGHSTYRPQHVVTVPDAPELSPGTGEWSITARFRTTGRNGNMMQKGQAGAPGGYVKMQMPMGRTACLFRGVDGTRTVKSPVPLNDGAWHVVKCTRSGDTVTMLVDGAVAQTRTGPTGSITNNTPFSIGGKSRCDGATIGCDYWSGEIDYVVIAAGA